MKKHKLTFNDYAPFIEDLIERELTERGFSITAKAVYSEEPDPHFDITIDFSLVPSVMKKITKATAEKKIESISTKIVDMCKHTSFPLITKWYYTFVFHNIDEESKMSVLYFPLTDKMSPVENQ